MQTHTQGKLLKENECEHQSTPQTGTCTEQYYAIFFNSSLIAQGFSILQIMLPVCFLLSLSRNRIYTFLKGKCFRPLNQLSMIASWLYKNYWNCLVVYKFSLSWTPVKLKHDNILLKLFQIKNIYWASKVAYQVKALAIKPDLV